MTAWAPDVDQLVEQSAAPARTRASLARVAEADAEVPGRLAAHPDLARAVVAVVAASRSLARLVEREPGPALAVLGDLGRRPEPGPWAPAAEGGAGELARWKQLELLRLAARDLCGLDDLGATGAGLADLATDVLAAAWALAAEDHPAAAGLAVVGMGKLGGSELNYASDVDVVLVGEEAGEGAELAARAVLELARTCFRVDADLRPEGRNGPLVRTLASYEAYWERWAEPWEFQALLKARPVAGRAELGRRWHGAATERLWGRPMGADDLRSLRAMKARVEAEVARRGLVGREVKRGPGGIRDIEFTVQLLQLVHGHADPDLRSPTTLAALAEMGAAGYVDLDDARTLDAAYRFLRDVEHRLQLVDDQQVHTVPADEAGRDHLARALGLRDQPGGSAVDQLDRELRRQLHTVRAIHERVYFRPLLEAFSAGGGRLNPEAAADRLTAFGFTDALRTRAAVRELTQGLNRSSRLMQQLLPLLLDWLSGAPDPDLGLLMLRNLLSDQARARVVVAAFRDSPAAAQRLCTVLGTSRLLGDVLLRNPDLTARLPQADQLRTRERDELVASATSTVAWRPEPAQRQEALRRWKDRHLFGIAARDLLGQATVEVVGRDLTTLAEAAIDTALASLDPQVPLAVIGVGRFGGAELSYASDLDLLFAHEGGGAGAAEEAQRVAGQLVRLLHGSTPAARVFEVDVDLRPEGRNGRLAPSVEGYLAYWDRYAETWERQAMVRARPVAGDRDLGARLLDLLEPRVWGEGLRPDEEVAIRRMKARVESERIPPGEDPQFHLKLGRGSLSDVEFTAQLLQLRAGVRATSTIAALDALARAGALDPGDAEVLATSYRFCEQVRDRWFLVGSAASDSLPTQPEAMAWLARSLDTTPSELRERYRRVTRRARRVVERVFYGRG